MDKKAQSSIFAFWKLLLAILFFIPFLHIYKEFAPLLKSTISNPFILFVITIVPFIYWIAVAFLFVNTMRGNE
jgi:hypothetical protein